MSDTKFTKGQRFSYNGPSVLDVTDSDGRTWSVDMSNPRILAAAPEMYDINQQLVDTIRKMIKGAPVRDLDEVLSYAEIVAGKARGEG